MGKIGTMEIIIIASIALLVFGPTKLPQLGKAVGKTISNFKRGVADSGLDEAKEPQENNA